MTLSLKHDGITGGSFSFHVMQVRWIMALHPSIGLVMTNPDLAIIIASILPAVCFAHMVVTEYPVGTS